MKTILAIIVLSGLQFHTVNAENTGDKSYTYDTGDAVCMECAFLSPSIPLQATYEDQTEVKNLMIQDFLKPQPPAEADFSETLLSTDAGWKSLKPQVPSEADFSISL